MKQSGKLLKNSFLICVFSTLMFNSENLRAQFPICSSPSTVIYGLNNSGVLSPVTVSTGVVGTPLNPAYSGYAALSSNGVGYNQLNGNFYYFKRPPGSAPQEFVSFNPATNAVTVLADCPTTYSVYVGCVTNDGTGYYCWDTQASLYYYSVAANTWTYLTNVIKDQVGNDIAAVIKAHGSGDAAIDGKGNLLMLPSSASKYALYELKAPLPKTAVTSLTVTGIVPLTTPPSGFKFGGIAFNASGQIILSTATPSNKLYRLENDFSLTFLSNLTTDIGDLTSCNFPLIVLPVMLKNFTANENNGQVILRWEANASTEVAGYEVQHSINGKDWQDLSYISRTTIQTYTHFNPAQGHNYYRLSFVSADQQKKYSQTKTVNLAGSNAYSVWPNPVKQDLNIEVNTSNENPVKASIFDHTGKLLKECSLTAGVNKFDTKTFSPGFYLVKITSASGETFFQKVIKD